MALVTMNKLTIIGLQQHKDTLFDVLINTQCVQLTNPSDIEACSTVSDSEKTEALILASDNISQTIDTVTATVELYNAIHKKDANFAKVIVPKTTLARPLVEMSYAQLASTSSIMSQVKAVVNHVQELTGDINNSKSKLLQIDSEIERLQLYKNLKRPITSYKDTASTHVVLGSIANNNLAELEQLVADQLAELTVLDSLNGETLVQLLVHSSHSHLLAEASQLGLVKCSMTLDILPSLRISDLVSQKKGYNKDIDFCYKQITDYAPYVATLRTAYDYVAVQLAKQNADNIAPKTGSVLVLEGFVPADKVELVKASLDNAQLDVAVYTQDISGDEVAPTMYKNNAIVRQFEGVTNMYTPPLYNEIDPNPVMSFFYFIIFGMMVADMGYGLVLALAGLFAAVFIKQKTGIRSMLIMFGMCGLSAIGIGALYGSMFSYNIFTGVLPDASIYPKVNMVIALLFGLLHISAGYMLDFAHKLKQKQYVLAFGVSLMWALFFVFALFAVLDTALDFMEYPPFSNVVVPSIVTTVGMYGLLSCLAVAILCAGGAKASLVKRAMAGFGSVYGLLNLFGDVMSYIRIFGLMLSSAMMGVVINDLAMSVGSGGTILATGMSVALLVFAHLFNLVIAILGVYIHCGRLQYVEFFGKFYQGDGQMFVPFGSNIKYTLLKQ